MKTIGILGMALWVAGCAVVEEDVYHSFDAVKNIQSTRVPESSEYLQNEYAVHAQSRLLLRYEKLLELENSIVVNGQHPFKIEVSLVDEAQVADALDDLRLCPVSRNWMMLANWLTAHPYGGGERWNQAGGDFYRSDCMRGETITDSARTLSFDATNWLTQYVRARGVDLGLILINDDGPTLRIVGDAAGYLAPRLVFDRLTPVSSPYYPTDDTKVTAK